MVAIEDKDNKANIKTDQKWVKDFKKLILIITLKKAKQFNFAVTHVSDGNLERRIVKTFHKHAFHLELTLSRKIQ